MNSGNATQPDDLAVARRLMLTCYELYRRTPSGLSPEIAFFTPHSGEDFPKQHTSDAGGPDFSIKTQVHNTLRLPKY